jgi:hypothetical protein
MDFWELSEIVKPGRSRSCTQADVDAGPKASSIRSYVSGFKSCSMVGISSETVG